MSKKSGLYDPVSEEQRGYAGISKMLPCLFCRRMVSAKGRGVLTTVSATEWCGVYGDSTFKEWRKANGIERKAHKTNENNAKKLSVSIWEHIPPIHEGKAQPHNPLGHYQKREPFRQSRWSKNGLDHMFDHSYNHFISGCSAVGSAPALGAGRSPFKPENTVSAIP